MCFFFQTVVVQARVRGIKAMEKNWLGDGLVHPDSLLVKVREKLVGTVQGPLQKFQQINICCILARFWKNDSLYVW